MEPFFWVPVIAMLLYYVGVFYWTERKQETDKGERNNPRTIRMEREKKYTDSSCPPDRFRVDFLAL